MIRKALVGAIALAFGAAAQAQEKYEVKVAEFVGAQHFTTKWIMQWSEKLEKASNGRLVFKHFPNAQMAATPAHYDLARTGAGGDLLVPARRHAGPFSAHRDPESALHGRQRGDRHESAQ